jgi:fermentation-respiration switch protein FrsA (DUF1100 family)
VLGHSEGALIAALAAGEGGADGYISLAGPAQPGASLLRRQLRARLSGPLLDESERILSALERGERVESVSAPLLALYRPSVQPYLISWFRYVPAHEVARLAMPVLIVQGTTDLQVDTTEATALRAANRSAAYLRVPGMNHVLKLVDGSFSDQLASYSNATLPIAPALVDGVAAFISSLPVESDAGAAR